MPRITVVVKRFIDDPLGIDNKKDYLWTRVKINTEDVIEFEEYTKAKTEITYYDGTKIVINEPFDIFEQRMEAAEKFFGDTAGMAEEIAMHLVELLRNPTPNLPEDPTEG